VVRLDDGGVVEPGENPGLIEERVDQLGLGQGLGVQQLDRHLDPVLGVQRTPDGTDRATGDLRLKLVPAADRSHAASLICISDGRCQLAVGGAAPGPMARTRECVLLGAVASSLSRWLASLPADRLAVVLARRPETLGPPAPYDLSEVAHRLQAQAGQEAALMA